MVAMCLRGMTSTCVGAWGFTSSNATVSASSWTIFAGSFFSTILQKRQSAIGSPSAQNRRRESSRIVTGPSFTSSTSICARKTPVATASPFSRRRAQTRS